MHQRSIVPSLVLKGLSARRIHDSFEATLGSDLCHTTQLRAT
jgi:hypothetical protein